MRRFYQIDSNSLMIGSTSGSKKDCKMFVENQIERYADIPKNSHYSLTKASNEITHYEIQEDSVTGSVLKRILQDMDDSDETEVLVFDRNEVQYQIYQRSDGTLRTFIRKDDERIMPVDEEVETLEGDPKELHPYFSTSAMYAWGSAAVFAVSVAIAALATSVSISTSVYEDGYVDAIEKNPMGFLVNSGISTRKFSVEKTENLPLVGGLKAIDEFLLDNPGQAIEKLEYIREGWSITPHNKNKEVESNGS